VEAIVNWAVRHEVPAIALTDTNNLHGAVVFAQAAAAAGIKPIIGSELAWNGTRLRVYVENQTGYRNLCRILNSLSDGDSPDRAAFTSRCRPSFEDTTGLIAVGSSTELADAFPNRFYLDPTGHGNAPRIASFPVHYENAADRWQYDIVQSIRTLTLLRQQHPQKRLDGVFHCRTPREVRQLFADDPSEIARTAEIAERCTFAFTLGKPQFPPYAPTDGSTPADFLHRLVMDGLRRRYPHDHERLRPQLEEELGIITEVSYEEYFLVMWDILQECRRRGIDWITRGSAADSLACYCLGISGVCPIRFDLYFRRFLNKDRMALNKLPDIDVDFPHDRKDDVIDLIFEKHGHEHTAVVGGFSTMQSRSAFAEVAKVLGVAEYQVRRITERLPHFAHTGELSEAIRETRECADLPLDQEPYATALRMAAFLDAFPRYPKMHPCGLVLSRQPMAEITPCFMSAKGYPTTHFDMDSVEAVGLIKMDILAQGGLAVMRDVKHTLKDARTVSAPASDPATEPFDLDALEPWTDPKVWDLIASGGARSVHHIESPAMISLCKMCNVRDIDTLIAIVSVIRPGAANESHKMEFARRYQGLSPVRYAHPSLEPCTRSTFGLVVYEEHILQISEAFAGLPPGRADVLRRALAKEKQALVDEIHGEFVACARRQGRTEEQIAEVWKLVSGFRGYAFCKAHSTAYGVEAYQSAWLKLNFPAEFMAAVLSNGKGFYSPLVILECHRLGIPLLPPSINDPGPSFTVHAGKIRVPAMNVKGLTQRTIERLTEERSAANSLPWLIYAPRPTASRRNGSPNPRRRLRLFRPGPHRPILGFPIPPAKRCLCLPTAVARLCFPDHTRTNRDPTLALPTGRIGQAARCAPFQSRPSSTPALGRRAARLHRQRTPTRTLSRYCLEHLLPNQPPAGLPPPGNCHVRFGYRTTHVSPSHW
jgi:error-prone DNA polymerase